MSGSFKKEEKKEFIIEEFWIISIILPLAISISWVQCYPYHNLWKRDHITKIKVVPSKPREPLREYHWISSLSLKSPTHSLTHSLILFLSFFFYNTFLIIIYRITSKLRAGMPSSAATAAASAAEQQQQQEFGRIQ